jgi:hypothetical protein
MADGQDPLASIMQGGAPPQATPTPQAPATPAGNTPSYQEQMAQFMNQMSTNQGHIQDLYKQLIQQPDQSTELANIVGDRQSFMRNAVQQKYGNQSKWGKAGTILSDILLSLDKQPTLEQAVQMKAAQDYDNSVKEQKERIAQNRNNQRTMLSDLQDQQRNLQTQAAQLQKDQETKVTAYNNFISKIEDKEGSDWDINSGKPVPDNQILSNVYNPTSGKTEYYITPTASERAKLKADVESKIKIAQAEAEDTAKKKEWHTVTAEDAKTVPGLQGLVGSKVDPNIWMSHIAQVEEKKNKTPAQLDKDLQDWSKATGNAITPEIRNKFVFGINPTDANKTLEATRLSLEIDKLNAEKIQRDKYGNSDWQDNTMRLLKSKIDNWDQLSKADQLKANELWTQETGLPMIHKTDPKDVVSNEAARRTLQTLDKLDSFLNDPSTKKLVGPFAGRQGGIEQYLGTTFGKSDPQAAKQSELRANLDAYLPILEAKAISSGTPRQQAILLFQKALGNPNQTAAILKGSLKASRDQAKTVLEQALRQKLGGYTGKIPDEIWQANIPMDANERATAAAKALTQPK